jgi:hypothetical protein
MKTAIQELFSQLEIEHPNLFNTNTLEGRQFINDYYKFFELEKQQIIDAYYKGIQEQTQRGLFKNPEITEPEQYYNETFKCICN